MLRRFAPVMLAFGLVISDSGTSSANAQTVDELREEFDRKLRELREEFERKLREAVEREVAKAREDQIRRDTKTGADREREAIPPGGETGTQNAPPAAAEPAWGLSFAIEFSGTGFAGLAGDYAARNAPGSFPPSPSGKFQSVDVDRSFAARPSLSYYLPGGLGIISANFYHLDASGSDSFRAPGAVVMTVAPPDVGADTGIFLADSASARNRVDLTQLDVEYRYPIQLTRRFTLTPEVGLRGLWLENDLKSSYFTDAGGFFFSIEQKFDRRGIGPKLGLAGSWQFVDNFRLSAEGRGGYLLGSSTAAQMFCRGSAFLIPGCGPPHNFKLTESRGFPFVEGELALHYAPGADTRWSGLSASLGYRLGTFFDLITRHREIGHPASIQIISDRFNVTYDSVFFTLRYRW